MDTYIAHWHILILAPVKHLISLKDQNLILRFTNYNLQFAIQAHAAVRPSSPARRSGVEREDDQLN